MINPGRESKDRLTIRVDHQRKQAADSIAKNMGTDLSNLVNIFLAQLVTENGMPFKPSANSEATELDEALADVKAGRVTGFANAEDLFKHLREVENSAND